MESLPWFRGENLFHTQGGFSVLTLLAFGDEKYYICIEIWEEPRLPPFFVTFPLKTAILGAHLGKICLPLILICLPQIFLSLPLSKTKRRVGKIWRRKVFPKVKNVNVKSPKKRSKLLVFSARFFLFPLQVCSWMVSSKRLSFFLGTNWLFEQGLNKDWTRIVHELFTICSEINETFNETINGH